MGSFLRFFLSGMGSRGVGKYVFGVILKLEGVLFRIFWILEGIF